MSAPIDNRGFQSNTHLRSIGLNAAFIFVMNLFLFVPLNSNGYFDIINDTLFSIKAWCFVIALQSFACWFIVERSHFSKAKTSNSLKIFSVIGRAILLIVSSVFFFYIIAVLFGAAFTEYTEETFHFAMLVSVTSVFPAVLNLGTTVEPWIRVFMLNSPEVGSECVVQWTTLLSIIGAWLGAFPIPLDWDRPWQVWPISCVIGTILGYLCGLAVGSVQLWRTYQRMNKLKLT